MKPNSGPIVIVAHNLQAGGAAIACKRLRLALQKHGFEPQMILIKATNQDNPNSILERAKRFKSGALSRFDYLFCNFLSGRGEHWKSSGLFGGISSREILQHNPRAVNIHWIGHASLSLKQIEKLAVPIVITAHDEWWINSISHYSENTETYSKFGFRSSILDFIKKKKIRILSSPNVGVVCLSTEMLGRFLQEYPFLQGRIKLIPNPVNELIYWPSEDENLRNPEKTALYLGGFRDRRKGFDLLLEALKLCKESFTLVAPGFTGVEKTGAHNQITIVGRSYISNEFEVNRLYNLSEITIVPSRQEALPQVATESMMSGTPVVSFQVGGLVDIVIDGKTGVITKNFDTVKLASNIDKCIKNEIKKSLQTRNFALANFSSAVVAAKYISFIDYLYK